MLGHEFDECHSRRTTAAAAGGNGSCCGWIVVIVCVGGSHDGAAAAGGGWGSTGAHEPLRVAETQGLEHVRAVSEEPQAPTCSVQVQRSACAGISALPGPVREDQGSHTLVPFLRAPPPAGSLCLPPPAGLGQLGCPHRAPPGSLRGARWEAGIEPFRCPGCSALSQGS